MEKIKLPHMKPSTARQFNFYQIPKAIIDNESFSSLDGWAIILYGMMLDRASVSAENWRDFTDENGDLYIIFTVEEAIQRCRKGKKFCIKIMKQLEEIGLIERKRRGLGKPSITYVNDFTYASINPEHLSRYPSNTSEVSQRHLSRYLSNTLIIIILVILILIRMIVVITPLSPPACPAWKNQKTRLAANR